MTDEQKKLLLKKNTFLRYKIIKELYNKYKTEDIPTTKVLKKYIFPLYPISRTTLYSILNTAVISQLKEIEKIENLTTKPLDT